MVRPCLWLAVVCGLCLIVRTTSGGPGLPIEANLRPARPSSPAQKAVQPERRYREGTHLVDRIGRFKATGDRVTFYSREDGRQFPALENLALERVARVISETSDNLRWSVSGQVTEFRGQNYLLVTRAIVKAESTTAE